MAIRIDRNKNLLAYMGKNRKLVRVLTMTESGAIVQYELVDEPGKVYMPLIVKGKNVERFEILGEQLTLL
ncbi:hypothetical protein [Tissierella sp. Yu-01]|uniref:hypothetical protein n=1 Tax=Tissierella sp. Yu-01 TaxID=3035694 RepID=UPI00240E6CB7|nr:hypothetical protein [Tissierella sp. Yu-01]WFA10360.1 hypothetical protein P3962_07350 [Tissierella sp. Yu-01]